MRDMIPYVKRGADGRTVLIFYSIQFGPYLIFQGKGNQKLAPKKESKAKPSKFLFNVI